MLNCNWCKCRSPNQINLPSGETICEKHVLNLKKKVGELKNKFLHYEQQVKADLDRLVYEYFAALRNEIDIEREELKLKIDEFSDKLIAEIYDYEKECTENLATIRLESTAISQIGEDLKAWEENVERLSLNKEISETINMRFEEIPNQMETEKRDIKKELFLDHKKRFEFETKFLNVHDLFCKELEFKT